MKHFLAISMLCFLFSSLSFAAASSASAEDCSSTANLPADAVQIWQKPKTPTFMAASEVTSGPGLAVGARSDLSLLEAAKLKMFTPTRKTGKDKGSQGHGGFYQFQTAAKAADYTIAAPKGVWLEVIDLTDQKLVDSSDHEMVGDCTLYHKIVRFPLKANHQYGLQVSGVEDAKTSVMLVQAPAAAAAPTATTK